MAMAERSITKQVLGSTCNMQISWCFYILFLCRNAVYSIYFLVVELSLRALLSQALNKLLVLFCSIDVFVVRCVYLFISFYHQPFVIFLSMADNSD